MVMSLLGRMFRTRFQENHIVINLPNGSFPLFIEIECCKKNNVKGAMVAHPDMYFYQYRNTSDLHKRSMNLATLRAHGIGAFEIKSVQYAQDYKDGISFNIREYQRNTELEIISYLTKQKMIANRDILPTP